MQSFASRSISSSSFFGLASAPFRISPEIGRMANRSRLLVVVKNCCRGASYRSPRKA